MRILTGILIGLALAVPLRRALIHYSEHSLPPAYPGPKIITWHHGQKDTAMTQCEECGRDWPSYLAAEDCAEQDRLEDDDRRNGRLFRSNRG